ADDGCNLALGAYEKHLLAAKHDFTHQLLCGLELAQRLLQVDDMDPIALGEDEAAHLGVPATGLMPEVNPRLEEILDCGYGHGSGAGVVESLRPLRRFLPRQCRTWSETRGACVITSGSRPGANEGRGNTTRDS